MTSPASSVNFVNKLVGTKTSVESFLTALRLKLTSSLGKLSKLNYTINVVLLCESYKFCWELIFVSLITEDV